MKTRIISGLIMAPLLIVLYLGGWWLWAAALLIAIMGLQEFYKGWNSLDVHPSKEIGYIAAIERLGLEPMFDLGMRLGEGSGCPVAFKIIEAAEASMSLMKTLAEGAIDAEYLEEIKRGHYLD